MKPGLWAFALVTAAAAATTAGTVPLVRALAVRVGAVVKPDERRVHERPTATLGGLAMLLGALVGLVAAWAHGGFSPIFASPAEPIGVAAAAVLIYGVGFIDDLREVSAPAKVAGMVLAGSVLPLAGVSILFFRVPFSGMYVLSADLSALVTVLWVVGMANAVNLIDGLDGLAAGIVAIAAGAFFLYDLNLANAGHLRPANLGPLTAAITVGVCVGFLPHNFHPARIFMGDGGALLLGLLMAASTISVGGRTQDAFSGQAFFFFAPLVIPLLILGVPVLDALFAIVRRATSRSGIATADKGHLHHRLMSLGFGQRRSVLILWAWTAILSALVLYPTYTGKGDGIVPIGVAALGLVLYTLFHPGVRRARKERAAKAKEDAAAQHPTARRGQPVG
ncbi:MAG: glycosyltransferase family 4 protein [Acidimicrobiales bacterium]